MNSNALWEALRPKQWVKNLFLFAALIFSHHLTDPSFLFKVIAGFIVFCCLSSSIYLINDLVDIENDKNHPTKSQRPLASGRLRPGFALQMSIVLGLGAQLAAFALKFAFGLTTMAYLVLLCLYSFKLKKIVILDVMTIAFGFVLRVVGGAVIINVEISNWLLICTLLLALFLALSKRRSELLLLDKEATEHRSILSEYSPYFLDQMIAVVTASTLMAYSLYTMSPETIAKFHTHKLSWTIPFVLYGIFRYLYLVHQKEKGGDPTKVLLTDHPLIINTILWALASTLIIYL